MTNLCGLCENELSLQRAVIDSLWTFDVLQRTCSSTGLAKRGVSEHQNALEL